MKTTHLFSAGLACVLLASQMIAAADVAAAWNVELNLAQQAYSESAAGRDRADAILRTVLAATNNGLANEAPPTGANLDAATAQAAYSVLSVLYPGRISALDAELAESLANITDTPSAIAAGRAWGGHVAEVVLAGQTEAVLLNNSSFAETAQPSLVTGVREEQLSIGAGRYHFNLFAGATDAQGYVDGAGAAARFGNLGGIAVDAAGNVYLSEMESCTIRKVSPDGAVSTLAGTAGQKGSQDGAGTAARFNRPTGLAVDGAGNVYVADTNNHTIRKIDPTGNVITVAGTAGESGEMDGAKSVARLYSPTTVAVDGAGNLFVGEKTTGPVLWNTIRIVALDGTVSSLPSVLGNTSQASNSVTVAHIRVDRSGNVYVAARMYDDWDDIYYANIWKLTPAAVAGQYTASLIADFDHYYSAAGFSLDETGSPAAGNMFSPSYDFYSAAGGWQTRYIAGSPDFYTGIFAVGPSGKVYAVAYRLNQPGQAVEVGTFDPADKAPVIVVQPSDQNHYHDENVVISVDAVGTGTLTYQWYFNSTPISGATTAVLELPKVQVESSGLYSVAVTSGAETVTSRKAKLNVNSSSILFGTGGSNVVDSGSSSSAPASSGGGSFDQDSALVVLMLLAVAAKRRRTARATPV